jgi:hypothetical protein
LHDGRGLLDLAGFDHRPVEGKAVAWRGPIGGGDQAQLGAAYRQALVVGELAANGDEPGGIFRAELDVQRRRFRSRLNDDALRSAIKRLSN